MALRILRSQGTATPTSLLEGQLAYSYNSNKLFIGDSANLPVHIGGKDIVDQLTTLVANQTVIVDDLTTGGTTSALSAEQGKVLKGLVDALGASNHITSANFDNATNTLTFTAADGTTSTVVIPDDQVLVINDLTTGGTTNALSAEQGKVLKTQLDALSASTISTFTGLTDTPANYTGSANFWLSVNAAGDAVEFKEHIDDGTF